MFGCTTLCSWQPQLWWVKVKIIQLSKSSQEHRIHHKRSFDFLQYNNVSFGVPPKLSGFVCTFHPAAPGSTPKHAINAFSIIVKFVLYLSMWCEKRTKINKKEAGFGPFFNNFSFYTHNLSFYLYIQKCLSVVEKSHFWCHRPMDNF